VRVVVVATMVIMALLRLVHVGSVVGWLITARVVTCTRRLQVDDGGGVRDAEKRS
jgi:hypothetical protein